MDEQQDQHIHSPNNCECSCGSCYGDQCACEDGVCMCEECFEVPEFAAEEGYYRLRVKFGNDEFEFEASDRETMEDVGIKLLERTFGRYTGQGGDQQ